MIEYTYQTDFSLPDASLYSNWIERVVLSEAHTLAEVSYIFCDDVALHKVNMEYLNHDTYTDIISFDYTQDKAISGDIFISIERVKENAATYKVSFEEELQRVMIHGILHYCGYKDKTQEQAATMRAKEEEKMQMFHVEQ